MIKVLLVDDDFLVRTFLSGLIDWNKQGYDLVGTAQDGEQALQLIEEYHPDIVIADISMPVMDGITLIRRLKEAGNAAKIIVLSCHDDFEYVKEAMKLGADEYVLKNLLTAETLLSMLQELEKTIIQPLPRRETPEKERQHILQMLRGEAERGLEDFQVRAVMAVRVAEFEKRVGYLPLEQQERFQVSFVQVCQELSTESCTVRCAHVRREMYAILLEFRKGESRAQRQDALRQAANTLMYNADRYLAASLLIGVSNSPDFQADTAVCWREAQDALEATFYQHQAICFAWQCQPAGRDIPQAARDFCEHIGVLMVQRDGNAIRSEYNAALEAFAAAHTQSRLVQEWLLQADRMAGIGLREIPQHFSEFEGQEQAYLAFCEEMLPDLTQFSETIADTVRFIRKNYMNSISLNDAADEVHLNAAYLSFVFHKETGITFSEYLTSCRINRAKELLTQTQEKIAEIAARAGYNDKRHFCKTFKRITGVTPQDYRKQNTVKT